MKYLFALATAASIAMPSFAAHHAGSDYANFPVTLKGYQGKAKTSVSYTGQMARHLLHNALKSLSKSDHPAAKRQEMMMSYFAGSDKPRKVVSPSAAKVSIQQTVIDDISKGKKLSDKAYKGSVTGLPGNMTGGEAIAFMINKAAQTEGGFDPVTGLDYTQLISKFTMGAVFYHQAVDNYLDEKLLANNKPNNKPYKESTRYLSS